METTLKVGLIGPDSLLIQAWCSGDCGARLAVVESIVDQRSRCPPVEYSHLASVEVVAGKRVLHYPVAVNRVLHCPDAVKGILHYPVAVERVLHYPVAVNRVLQCPDAVKGILHYPVAVERVLHYPVAVNRVLQCPDAVRESYITQLQSREFYTTQLQSRESYTTSCSQESYNALMQSMESYITQLQSREFYTIQLHSRESYNALWQLSGIFYSTEDDTRAAGGSLPRNNTRHFCVTKAAATSVYRVVYCCTASQL
ncbi:hypothetical protein J6590_013437 [Homalodisca vitripennis]|nr:hypothetical protein J6590_013437 [Homalodisca vitripennis]